MQTTRLPVTVPDLDVQYPRKPPVPEHMPAMYFIMGIVGSRGSGKTTKLMQMLQLYDRCKTFDVIRIFCPSYDDDVKYRLLEKMDCRLVVQREYNDGLFSQCLAEVDADLQEHEDYLKKRELYRRWLKDKNEMKEWRSRDLQLLEEMGHKKPKRPFRYGKPNTLLIMDDLSGTSLYRSDSKGPFNAFAIRHRHRCCSIIMLTQTFFNSIPRGIRTNLSAVMLFSNRNAGMAAQICAEFSSYISVEQFQAMWDAATEEPHDCFFVDFEAPLASRYRKNFDLAFVVSKRVPGAPEKLSTKQTDDAANSGGTGRPGAGAVGGVRRPPGPDDDRAPGGRGAAVKDYQR